ncbi:ATP-binding protein [uncultured Zoogloea sp.]|mgnify:CR=1 FL=1|uniref:ATP-binding protein n=1 Tax=uncultured Zoogloea sp. TaxID=160237 RepID=UPI002618230B|nr:ATP-binding protein [uncultured Zoogloea sp.]
MNVLSRFLSTLLAPERQRRFVVVLIMAVVLSNLLAIGLGVFSLIGSRAQTEALVAQNARNLAGALDQGLANSGRTIDLALRALADELEREEAEGQSYLTADEIRAMLMRYKGWLPEIEGVRVYDANGALRWEGALGPVLKADISDREYFRTLKANPAAGLTVSRPVIGRVVKIWIVPFARRYNRADGSFAGVVVAIVPVEYLTAMLSRPSLGPGGSAMLRYQDLSLITRYPPVTGPAGEIGEVWSAEGVRERLGAGQNAAVFRATDSGDGGDGSERFLAVQRVDGLPFVVGVSLSSHDYLVQWYREAWQTGILLTAFLIVSGGSALLIGHLYRRQQDDASQVRESNVRLAATLGELRVRDRALAAAEGIGKLGVYSIDLSNKVTTSSPTLRDVFRVPRERPFVPEDWIELVHPDDRRVIERFMVGLVQNGEPFDQSYRIICRDGAIRWVHGVGLMERDAAGHPLSVHGAVQDITEYKQVEDSLQSAVADYEKLVARIPTGVFGFRWQPDGLSRFTYVSPRFCSQLGVTVEAAMADARQVFSQVHPDDRPALKNARAGSFDSERDFTWEGRVRVRGEVRWVGVIARPTRLDDGAVLWEGVQADVTDRKLAELARSESEERNRLLLQYSPVGILQYGTDLKVVYCNLQFANIMAVPHEYMLSLDCKTLKDQRIVPAMRAALAGELGEYEGGYRTSYAGKELLVSVSCAPLRDADGDITGGIIILQDVTERIRKDEELARYRDSLEELVAARTADLETARAEAERLARVKSEFLANMSHEIRTPLNGVLGLARMGYRESVGRDAARNTFGRILSSGQLLLGIINDILDFSKIEAGKLRIEAIEVDLVKVIGDTLALMEERAEDKGLSIRLQRAPSLPAACISDPLRIGQILVNLLSNAIKFTEHGSVTLYAGAEGDELVLRISDTGIGMRQADIDKVFAPFEQADNSTTRKFGGTGLGLTITHRIVGLMGGSLRASSVEGEGSTFEVRLPYVPLVAAHAEAVPEGADGEPGTRLAGIRVLVAEDNEVNQMVLEDHLCSEGAEVTLVENGQAAIDCVQARGASAFDVVLMDVQMPVMDGHTATRLLGGIAPDLPVIGQTAHALDEERAACLAAGMVDHLAKPIEPEAMVRSILRHRRPASA